MRWLILLPIVAISACAAPSGPYPSLQPRAAEDVDPRLPIVRPINGRPVTPALAARLSALVDAARSGTGSFDAAADEAERLAGAAGSPQSEGWIAAQEALTAAIAAREPTSRALAEIDALAAEALQRQGGFAPSDLAAIKDAQAEAGAIDARQAARIEALQKRLGG